MILASTSDVTGQLDLGRESVKAVRRFEPICRTSSRKNRERAEIRTLFFRDTASPAAWFRQGIDMFLSLVMSRVSNLTLSDNHAPIQVREEILAPRRSHLPSCADQTAGSLTEALVG